MSLYHLYLSITKTASANCIVHYMGINNKLYTVVSGNIYFINEQGYNLTSADDTSPTVISALTNTYYILYKT